MTATVNNVVRPSAMSSTLDARISDLRSGMSTSSFLFNLLIANTAINALLLPCALLSIGARHGYGSSLLLASTLSCAHVACMAILRGDRVADALIPPHAHRSPTPSCHRLANALRVAHASFGSDPYLGGVAFGLTAGLAVLMRAISSQWDGISECIALAASSSSSSSSSSCVVGAHPGPARAVSFLSGILSWLDVAMAVSMYSARRRESGSLSPSSSSSGGWGDFGGGGGGGGFGLGIVGGLFSSTSNDRRYEEIVDGFDGDFPSSTTIRV